MPYRVARHAAHAFVPSLGWTRRAAVVIAALGATAAGIAVRHMLIDHDCDNQATPHLDLVALVVGLTVVSAWACVKTQRLVARRIARRVRVRSAFAGALVASLAIAPALLIELVNGSAALAIDFGATFNLCFDFDPTRAFFPLGC